MPYCTVEDVGSLMRLEFSPASSPTEDEVENFISTVAGELDGVAEAAGYSVPVTASAAVELMKQYNTFGAAVQAWYAAGFDSDTERPRVAFWRESYNNFLVRLRRGEQKLPGEEADAEQDVAFDVAPHPSRDRYWLTGRKL